jgi:small-conductance mechanosensitive channel
MQSGQKNNVHYGIENIARFLIGIGIITTVLGSLGIQLWELITSITIVATAIAILTKEYISDFLVGIHLSFSNIFEVGDFVKLGNQVGEIVGINMLKTLIKDEHDDIIMLPNTKVHYNEIINFTKKNIRVMNINFEIGIEYISKIEQLHQNISEAVTNLSKEVIPNSCHLQIINVHNDYMDVKFQYKLKKVDLSTYGKIRRTAINVVFKYLKTYEK